MLSQVANTFDKPPLNDVMFIPVIRAGQKYRSCIFLQPNWVIKASNKELVASLLAVLEGTMVKIYSQSTRGPELLS